MHAVDTGCKVMARNFKVEDKRENSEGHKVMLTLA